MTLPELHLDRSFPGKLQVRRGDVHGRAVGREEHVGKDWQVRLWLCDVAANPQCCFERDARNADGRIGDDRLLWGGFRFFLDRFGFRISVEARSGDQGLEFVSGPFVRGDLGDSGGDFGLAGGGDVIELPGGRLSRVRFLDLADGLLLGRAGSCWLRRLPRSWRCCR